ncbi:hypothetical protein [Streptomyces sp. NPDC003480]
MAVGREIGAAFGHAWRVAGCVSPAVGRSLGPVFRWIFVEPGRWAYRTMPTPVGRMVRETALRPVAEAARSMGGAARQTPAVARETARQTRADTRRALFGESRGPERISRREPDAR